MKWVDIREKKPNHKNWKMYLAFVNEGMCVPRAGIMDSWSHKLVMYRNEEGFCIDGVPTDRVTHWMELPPSPPKISLSTPLQRGASGYIAKPFHKTDVSIKVAEAMKNNKKGNE